MLGDKIRVLRKKKALSQEDLALKMHVVRQTVSKWENGLSVPDADELIELTKVLDVSVGELLGMETDLEPVRSDIVAELESASKELAERKERERLLAQANKVRGGMIGLILLGVILLSVFSSNIVASVAAALCFLLALVVLYKNLGLLTVITTTDYKLKPLRITTVFNIVLIVACVISIVLIETGFIRLSQNSEKYVAAFIVGLVILFSGIIATRLPFSKHTGLRLPWTVTDEETWNIAHHTLGIVAIPIGVIYIGLIPFIANFELLTGIIVGLWIGLPTITSGIFFYRKFHK